MHEVETRQPAISTTNSKSELTKMATIIKRGESYCVKYRDPSRKQRWESFTTKKLAEARLAAIEPEKTSANSLIRAT